MIGLRRATLGWLRSLLAPNVVTSVGVIALVLASLGLLIVHYTVYGPFARSLSNDSEPLQAFVVTVAMLCGYYGLMRGFSFHPALDYRYHEWLQSTPWAPGAPLPKGPITPVWQDGVFLTLATLLTSSYASQTPDPTASALAPVTAMAAGLAVAWSVANFVTRNLVAVYLALLVLPVITLAFVTSQAAALTFGCVVSASVAYTGVVWGMRRYPWQVFPRDKNYVKRLLNPHDQRQPGWQATASVGWPYTQLLNPPKGLRVSLWRATLEAAIAGSWAALLARMIPPNQQEVAWLGVFQFGCFLVVGKLVSNTIFMCPKLCLGERIARRRPIIWRHDRLLLEPLLVAAVLGGIAAAWNAWSLGPHWLGVGLAAAVGVWLCRRLGQSSAERFYTGPQMVAGVAPNAAFFKRLASPGE